MSQPLLGRIEINRNQIDRCHRRDQADRGTSKLPAISNRRRETAGRPCTDVGSALPGARLSLYSLISLRCAVVSRSSPGGGAQERPLCRR